MNAFLVNRRARVIHRAYGPARAVPEDCNVDQMDDFYLTAEDIREGLKVRGYRECERCFPPPTEALG